MLTSWLIDFVGRSAARRFLAATRDPVAVQDALLREIIRRNEQTEYGRDYGFRAVKSFADYRAAVPIVDYDAIEDRVERVTMGERNVLTAEDPVMFARTSGTTGKAKFIPVTPTCQGRDGSDPMRAWLHHAMKDHPQLFRGKVVSLVSPAIEGMTPSGLPYGSTSGHIYKTMPRLVRSTYAIPYEVFEIEDYETKYYVLLRLALGERVTFLSTANPSSVMKLCELADQWSEPLLRDLSDGTLRSDMNLPEPLRRRLAEPLKANPERAKELAAARAHRGGRLLPADYWPDLAMIGCWKGGTVGAYLERFGAWFDPDERREVPVRDWGYLSSEARASVPLSDDGYAGVLTVASTIFEFVSTEEVERAPDDPHQWTFHGVGGVEISREYYVFLTTSGGLYRYDINDIIQVVDFYGAAPMVVFRRKGRGMTSITGEKVSVNQVIEAFQRAAREQGVLVDHFKAEADQKSSRYVFKVESSRPIEESRRVALLRSLDEHLSALNLEYDAKRRSGRLAKPILHVMKLGWYDRSKRRLVSEGKRLWQAKTVLLSTRQTRAGEDDLEAVVYLPD